MADAVIKTLTIRGVDETKPAVDGLNKTAAAYDNVSKAANENARITDTSAKRHLSLADSVAKAERQFNSALRAQQDFEKIQRQMNAAVAQNPALQERANAVLALAAERYGQTSTASKAFAAATSGVSAQLIALSAGAGPVGVFLSALGPWGIAAAAALGAVGAAFRFIAEESGRMGEKAIELRAFSDVTGLTVAQIAALRRAGGEAGVAGDTVASAYERLTFGLNDARRASGSLFDETQQISRGLADELRSARTTAEGIDVLARAYKATEDSAQRAAIARAAFGRQGVGLGPTLLTIADAGGINNLNKAVEDLGGLTDAQNRRFAEMKAKTDELNKSAKNIFASIFTEEGLAAALKAAELLERSARAAKDMADQQHGLSGFQKFFADLARQTAGVHGIDPELINKPMAALAAQQRAPAEAAEGWKKYEEALAAIPGPAERAATAIKVLQDNAAAGVKVANDNVAALGSAATIDDKYTAGLQRLNSELLNGKIGWDIYNRAVKGLDTAEALRMIQATVAALGTVATPTEQYAARLGVLRNQLALGEIAQQTFNRAVAGLKSEFALQALQETIAALGAAATPAEQLKEKFAELEQKLAAGKITLDTFNRSIADFQKEQDVTKLKDNVTALGSAATAAQQYQLRVVELQQQLDRGRISQDTFNRAVFEANPIVQELKSDFGDLAKGMVQSMLAGKSFTESLSTGLKQLSARLADKAIESLLNGDFAKAAIQGIGAVVTAIAGLFVKTNDLKGVIDTLDRLNQLRLRQVQATNDTNTLQGQLAVFNANALLEQIEEARKGGALMGALLQVQAAERLKIETDFQKQAAQIEQQAAEDRLRKQEEIENRRKSFQDRLFGATNDTSTLAGQLAAFDRQAQQQRIDEQKSGGEAIADLEAALAAERLNVIRDFNDKAVEESKRAAQEQLDAQTRAAKGIVDYINNLKVGPDSSLSPTARLAAAQSTYNSILALAQGGNVDALGRITQDFENFRKAAQAVYGSATPYQNILNAGIAQLQGLPAVATSSDPVVQAILGTTAAVQATTTAVNADTAATVAKLVDAVNQLTTVVSREDTANTFLNSMNTFTNRIVNAINNHGGMSSTAFTSMDTNLARIRSGTDWIATHTTGGFTPGFAVSTTGATPVSYTSAEFGGTVPPHGLVIFGEHHPQGPFFGRAGDAPIPITPAMPSFGANDNAGIRQELSDIKRILAAVGAAMVNAETKTGAEVAGAIVAAINGQTETIKSEARQDRANPQKKVA